MNRNDVKPYNLLGPTTSDLRLRHSAFTLELLHLLLRLLVRLLRLLLLLLLLLELLLLLHHCTGVLVGAIGIPTLIPVAMALLHHLVGLARRHVHQNHDLLTTHAHRRTIGHHGWRLSHLHGHAIAILALHEAILLIPHVEALHLRGIAKDGRHRLLLH